MIWDQIEQMLSKSGAGVSSYYELAEISFSYARENPDEAVPFFY